MQFLPIVQSFFSSSFESYLWLIWVTSFRWCHWNESYIFIVFYLVHSQTALQNCVKSYIKWRHHQWRYYHYDVIIHPNLVSMECYDSVSTFVSSPEFKNQEIEDFHILSFLEKSKSSRHRNECTVGSYRGSRTSPNPCWVTFRFISIGIYS